MLGQGFVHLEHICSGPEDLSQLLVAAYLSFVLGILQVVLFNVIPDGLHNLQHSSALSGSPVLIQLHSCGIYDVPRWRINGRYAWPYDAMFLVSRSGDHQAIFKTVLPKSWC